MAGFNMRTEDRTQDYAIGNPSRGLIPRFYVEPEMMRRRNPVTDEDEPVLDLETGAPKMVMVEFVQVYVVGNNRKAPARRVTEKDRTYTFREAYDEWKNGRQRKVQDGTALADLPGFTNYMIAMLENQNVFTAEQLAGLSDRDIDRIGVGAAQWREQAAMWLKRAKDGAKDTQTAIDLATMRRNLAALTKKLEKAEADASKYKGALEVLQEGDIDDDDDEPAASAPRKGRRKGAKATGSKSLSKADAARHRSNPNAVKVDSMSMAVASGYNENTDDADDNPFADGDGDPVDAVLEDA